MSTHQRRSAFTLIELLVVIAILAILAAILFPVFAKAREKARQASCGSNYKQVAVAILMYSQDYDERTLHADHTTGYAWFDPLQAYVKSEQMFKCPSMRAENPDPETDTCINALFVHSVSFAQFDQPAGQIMLGERRQGVFEDDYHCFYDTSVTPWTVDEFEPGHLQPERHNGGSNYSFADGHTKWQKWSQTLQPSGNEANGPTAHNIDGIPEP